MGPPGCGVLTARCRSQGRQPTWNARRRRRALETGEQVIDHTSRSSRASPGWFTRISRVVQAAVRPLAQQRCDTVKKSWLHTDTCAQHSRQTKSVH
jgi:hypothetical protein